MGQQGTIKSANALMLKKNSSTYPQVSIYWVMSANMILKWKTPNTLLWKIFTPQVSWHLMPGWGYGSDKHSGQCALLWVSKLKSQLCGVWWAAPIWLAGTNTVVGVEVCGPQSCKDPMHTTRKPHCTAGLVYCETELQMLGDNRKPFRNTEKRSRILQ